MYHANMVLVKDNENNRMQKASLSTSSLQERGPSAIGGRIIRDCAEGLLSSLWARRQSLIGR
jgi:hypothetical protein